MKYPSIPAAAALMVSLIIPDHSGAAVGDIVNTISRSGHGWFGGITWYKGYIYEVSAATGAARIEKKDPVTGSKVAEYYTPVDITCDGWIDDIAYDSRRECFWISVGAAGIYQCSLKGGDTLSHFYPGKHPYGLYYEAATDLLWIADNVNGRIDKWDLNSFQRVERISLDFLPTGITRVGNDLWICEAGDYDVRDPAVVSRCDLQGKRTGVWFELPSTSGYWWDHGGSTFDGTYLWVKGGKYTRIYQIDIGDNPSPRPTPVSADSFTYSIGTLFDDNAFTDLIDTDNAVFNPEGAIGYWCPTARTEETAGSVVYRIDLPVVIATASLTAAGAVFWGEGELTVEVSPDGGSYHEVYTLPRGGGDTVSDNQERDITAYVAGSSTVYVRARMRAGSSYCSQFLRNGSTGSPVLSLRGLASPPAPATASRPPLIESGDYDGDGAAEIAVFRESSGLWSIRGVTRVYFGAAGDIPVSGDYNGDGTAEIALYRPGNGLWAVNGIGRAYFGGPNDLPLPGDYNNNGQCDLAIFRENTGLWAIRGVTRFYFGGSGDQPVPADYDERRRVRYRPLPGRTRALGDPGSHPDLLRQSRRHRGPGAVLPPRQPFALRRLPILTGLWSIRDVSRFYFGAGSDCPVPGDYTREGCSQPAVFDGDSGRWAIRGVSRLYFGTAGDIPVTR